MIHALKDVENILQICCLLYDVPEDLRDLSYYLFCLLFSKDIEEKYNGKLKQEMSGPLFEVVSRVLKEIIGRKITVPGSFKGYAAFLH